MKRCDRLIAHTVSHFAVDFACFYMLFAQFIPSRSGPYAATVGMLAYNTIAFGLQPFIGLWCDERGGRDAAWLGCALVAMGLFSPSPVAALIVCGLGNAIFHVGGGRDSLIHAEGRMARPGVFVSTGAMGVALGTILGKGGGSLALPVGLLCAGGLACLFAARTPERQGQAADCGPAPSGFPFALLCGACLLAVALRAAIGAHMALPWRAEASGLLQLLPALCAMLGKALGGFAADRLGARRVAVGCAVVAAPLLLVRLPAVSALGILLFNAAMPITLCSLAALLPRTPGLAFGLTTLALLCGTIPSFFWACPSSVAPYLTAGLSLASAVCLYCSAAGKEMTGRHDAAASA